MAGNGAVSLLVGTAKGAFIVESAAARRGWRVRGPFCHGWPINHVIGEAGTGRLWAAGGGPWHGAGVWRSDDGGESWTLTKLAGGAGDDMLAEAPPEFAAALGLQPATPGPFTNRITSVWSLAAAPGRLYAGAMPATLLESRDGGESWREVKGLSRRREAESWQPGGAGLTLHTILTDPDRPGRLWVGISAAGMFASEDGGESWEPRNRRSNARADGEETGIGPCVHNAVRATRTGDGDLLYQQNHDGVFRSADGGRSWSDISEGLPSRFGFPVAVHPRDPATLWVVPLNGDIHGRYPPDGIARVWRSRDGGDSWQALEEGLPARDCFFTVLRQAMATDAEEPGGIYFGTNSGSIFASADEGAHWREIARHLPTVLSVEAIAGN